MIKPLTLLLASGLLAAYACSTEGPRLETVSVLVDVRDPFNARPPGELSVGLLWTTTGTIYGSSHVPLLENENTVELPLGFPEPRPGNLFIAEFALTQQSIVVHVPRIAIYRDDDGSGDFTPWNLDDDDPPDQIVAVNGSGTTVVAGVRDFEFEFRRLPAVDVNTYYSRTNGVHTDFIRFPGATSTLTPSILTSFGLPVASLYFDDSPVPARDIRCINSSPFQSMPELQPISAAGTSSRSITILVDDSIDAESICGLSTPNCQPVDITTTTTAVPTPLASAGRRIFSQCRFSPSFESLVTLQAELQCDRDCNCGWVERQQALIVRTSSTPAGWPCGDTVDFCGSDLPLFRIDEACEIDDEEDPPGN